MFAKTSNPYKFKYLITGINGPGIEQVYLPEVPSERKILFKKEKKWTRPEMSPQLKKWVREWKMAQASDPKAIHAQYDQIVAWEDQQWDRATNGCFFYNAWADDPDKEPEIVYLTGFHYWYLTEWQPYFGRPDFRDSDREIFYWIQFWEEDPDSYGGALNTIRRYAKSTIMSAWIVYRTTMNYRHNSGMQGETDKKIAKFYKKMVLKPFYKLPYYFQPEYNTDTKQTTSIEFDLPPQRSKKRTYADWDEKETLESMIDYRSSGEGEYDGDILNTYIMEEPGKCHGKDTPIMMYNGNIKKVQNVKVGDLLMGDDSTPRVVKELVRGEGRIYRIMPTSNKAKSWTVNEDHILSCKVSSSGIFKGFKHGDVRNISVKEYFKLTPNQQRHLMCYRVGVDFKEKKHNIDPYFLGLWLGDGSGATICSADHEIIDYVYEFAKENRYSVKVFYGKNDFKVFYLSGGLRTILRKSNLLNNKHIPKNYMLDSRSNRLKLLAGLIDTDGHRENRVTRPNKRYYEITQKRKALAEQIQQLALSLGFYASFNRKIATMKRKDGTIYRRTVYRVGITGFDLHEIPCKIERKKMPSNITTYNSKNPTIYGFKIIFDKVDKYYGFNISGNRLYLLGDYTVTHNCVKVDIYNNEGEGRWDIVKPCFLQGDEICGKAFLGTTVDYLSVTDKGGAQYKALFYDSNYNQKEEDGRTKSGLYSAFLPGDCAMKGYFDENGRPIREQAKAKILLTRKSYKGNPRKLAGWIRKFPLTITEIFYVSPDRCEFNAQILQDRLEEIESRPEPFTSTVDFYWENNIPFTKVKWRHNPNGGWAQIASPSDIWKKEFEHLTNQVGTKSGIDKNGNEVKMYFPKNDGKYCSGLDPIQHGSTGSSTESRPVQLVKSKYDVLLDGPLDQDTLERRAAERYQYKSNRYLLQMDHRPTNPLVLAERILMICWYFGISVHVEKQMGALIIGYFHEHGCGDFILEKYKPDFEKPDRTPSDGTAASKGTIQEYTGNWAWYIDYFGHTIPFKELLSDSLIFDAAKTTVHDYTVAAGWTELAERMKPKNRVTPFRDLSDFMPTFDGYGNVLN